MKRRRVQGRLSVRAVVGRLRQWHLEGRLPVIKAVLAGTVLHVTAVLWLLWLAGAELRVVFDHPLDMMIQAAIALGLPVGLAALWRRLRTTPTGVRLLEWFGGVLVALVSTTLLSMVNELVRVERLPPALAVPIANGWALWAVVASGLLVVGAHYLSAELTTERRERERLQALMEFTRRITGLDYQAALDEAVAHLKRLLKADAVVLYLWSDQDRALVPVAGLHSRDLYSAYQVAYIMSFKCPMGYGMTGYVMETGRPYITGDISADPRAQGLPGQEPQPRSALLAPIQTEGRRLGVVRLTRRGVYQFTREDLELAMSFAGQAALVIEHARIVREMSEMLESDHLTGLKSARRLHEVLDRMVEQARRTGRPLALLTMEVEGLKQINEAFGHHRGDEYLRAAAAELRRNLRPADDAFREGGGRFLVLLADTEPAMAAEVGERIREGVTRWQAAPGTAGAVSVGIAVLPDHARDGAALLQAADEALREARRTGRNRVMVAGPSA